MGFCGKQGRYAFIFCSGKAYKPLLADFTYVSPLPSVAKLIVKTSEPSGLESRGMATKNGSKADAYTPPSPISHPEHP